MPNGFFADSLSMYTPYSGEIKATEKEEHARLLFFLIGVAAMIMFPLV